MLSQNRTQKDRLGEALKFLIIIIIIIIITIIITIIIIIKQM